MYVSIDPDKYQYSLSDHSDKYVHRCTVFYIRFQYWPWCPFSFVLLSDFRLFFLGLILCFLIRFYSVDIILIDQIQIFQLTAHFKQTVRHHYTQTLSIHRLRIIRTEISSENISVNLKKAVKSSHAAVFSHSCVYTVVCTSGATCYRFEQNKHVDSSSVNVHGILKSCIYIQG